MLFFSVRKIRTKVTTNTENIDIQKKDTIFVLIGKIKEKKFYFRLRGKSWGKTAPL
jgi:hypothetical protein